MTRGALVLAAGAAVLLLAGAVRAAETAPPALRWGGDAEGGAPFVEADPADPTKLRGFDVEIANLVARKLGRTPVFVQVAFQSLGSAKRRTTCMVGKDWKPNSEQKRGRTS